MENEEKLKKIMPILKEMKETNIRANISSFVLPFVEDLNRKKPAKFVIDIFNDLINVLENKGYDINNLDNLRPVHKKLLRDTIENHMKNTLTKIQPIFGTVAKELAANDLFMVPFANDLYSNNPKQFAIDTIYRLIDILESKEFDLNNLSPIQRTQLHDEIKTSFKNISMNIFYNYADPKQKKIIDGFKLTIEALQKDQKITEERMRHVEKNMNRTFRPKLKKENDKKEIEELQKRMDSLEKNIVGSTNKLRSILFDEPKEKSMTQQTK